MSHGTLQSARDLVRAACGSAVCSHPPRNLTAASFPESLGKAEFQWQRMSFKILQRAACSYIKKNSIVHYFQDCYIENE